MHLASSGPRLAGDASSKLLRMETSPCSWTAMPDKAGLTLPGYGDEPTTGKPISIASRRAVPALCTDVGRKLSGRARTLEQRPTARVPALAVRALLAPDTLNSPTREKVRYARTTRSMSSSSTVWYIAEIHHACAECRGLACKPSEAVASERAWDGRVMGSFDANDCDKSHRHRSSSTPTGLSFTPSSEACTRGALRRKRSCIVLEKPLDSPAARSKVFQWPRSRSTAAGRTRVDQH